MSQPPLTDKELEEVRDLLEADRRAKWLMERLKGIALWTAAVVGGCTLLWDTLARIIKGMIK